MKEKPSDKFGKSVKEVNDRVGRNPTAVSAKLLGNNLINRSSVASKLDSLSAKCHQVAVPLPFVLLNRGGVLVAGKETDLRLGRIQLTFLPI